MKFYQKPNTNRILALESNGSQDHLIEPDMILLSEDALTQLHTPDLVTSRVNKVKQIENARDTACLSTVTVEGIQWQADEVSKTLLSNAIMLASLGLPLPPVWRDANNVDHAITHINQLLAIAGAMAVQTQAAYSKSWALKAQINVATLAEIKNINW